MATGSQNIKSGASGSLPAGSKIGKYVVVEQLGAGGQSIVYKAHDPVLDRFVAIKQIAPYAVADQTFLRRFREVAQQLARLNSEHVVMLHDLLEDASGLYVVMEYVEGPSLEGMLAGGSPLDSRIALQVIWRIASGLSAIHRAGIIHRDIKPGNVLIGEGLRVKITDFGVAARAGAAASMRLGTTKYMAPELFSNIQVDGRADIYSLGMIAYEMLAGRQKFNEIFRDIVRDPHSEALRWMKWHSSPELTAPPLTEVNPGVPAPLAAIVAKMLAKDPQQRYADVEALGKDIRANFSRNGRSAHLNAPTLGEAAAFDSRLGAEEVGELALPTPQPSAQEAMTATLPRRSMSLRRKLTIAGSLIGMVVVGLVVLLVLSYSHRAMFQKQAEGLHSQAAGFYQSASKASSLAEKKTQFTRAEQGFKQVMQEFPGKAPLVVHKAEVMDYLTLAQLDVLDNNSNEVDVHWTKATEANKDIQRTHDTLYSWTQDMERDLNEFHNDYWLRQRDYHATLDHLKAAMSDGKLAEALDDAEKASKLTALMSEQLKEVQDLRAKILEMQNQKEYLAHLQKADQLAEQGQMDPAMTEYNQALAVLENGKESLAPSIYNDLKETAEKKKADLKVSAEFRVAVGEAEKALSENDMLAAADAYDKALKLKSDEAIAEKARDIRYNYWVEQARQHMAAAQVADALENFNKAKEYRDTPELQTELGEAIKARDYIALTQQGNMLLAQKKYDESLEKYRAAAKLRDDEAIKARIADAEFAQAMAEGDLAAAAKDWNKAEAAYKKADAFKPNTPEAKAHLDQVQMERKYDDLVAQAEAARAKGNYPEALTRLTAAKAVLAKPEVTEKINQVKYEDNLQRGKQELAEQNYTGALAYFRLARSFRQTPDVDKLIEEATKRP